MDPEFRDSGKFGVSEFRDARIFEVSRFQALGYSSPGNLESYYFDPGILGSRN